MFGSYWNEIHLCVTMFECLLVVVCVCFSDTLTYLYFKEEFVLGFIFGLVLGLSDVF